jgi:hypothetical protein
MRSPFPGAGRVTGFRDMRARPHRVRAFSSSPCADRQRSSHSPAARAATRRAWVSMARAWPSPEIRQGDGTTVHPGAASMSFRSRGVWPTRWAIPGRTSVEGDVVLVAARCRRSTSQPRHRSPCRRARSSLLTTRTGRPRGDEHRGCRSCGRPAVPAVVVYRWGQHDPADRDRDREQLRGHVAVPQPVKPNDGQGQEGSDRKGPG